LAGYKVVVEGKGSVYEGDSKESALFQYRHYVTLSDLGVGKSAGKDVSLFFEGQLVSIHKGDKK